MGYVPQPDSVATILASLQARVAALETGVAFNHSTINGGALTVYDNVYNPRVIVGKLPSGDYGLEVIDTTTPTANHIEVLPTVANYAASVLTTASTTPVVLSGSPSVTCMIGQSGDCFITAGAYVGVPGGCTGIAYVVVDGGTYASVFELGSAATAGIAGNPQSTRQYSSWFLGTLTPGSHTFTMKYSSSSGTSTFGANWLQVQPI